MSIAKRVLALAGAGAAALILGGALGASHQATHVDAAGPLTGALGCANSENEQNIQFPIAPGGIITTSNQTPIVNVAPAALSVLAEGAFGTNGVLTGTALGPGFQVGTQTFSGFAVVKCGAVFEDTNVPSPGGLLADADPTTIDGGTITFATTGIGSILESNANTYAVNCGSSTPPVVTPAGVVTTQGGLESCQGATILGGFAAVPTPGNTFHLAIRPGTTFGLIGAASPVITVTATYNRFQSLNAVAVGPATLTTNAATVGLVLPSYSIALSADRTTIPAALATPGAGTPVGATITATLSRQISLASQIFSFGGALGGAAAIGSAGPFFFVPNTFTNVATGAEPGTVTFTTNNGVFAAPGTTATSGQQTVAVACGANPGVNPLSIAFPTFGQPFNLGFSLASCTTAQATLYGGGSAGTATVVAQFVGSITGAVAQSAITIALSPTPASIALNRGCNEVIVGASVAAGTPAATIASTVNATGFSVVSIFRYNNARQAFDALYFSTPGAPVDATTVSGGQPIFVCGSGTGTFPTA